MDTDFLVISINLNTNSNNQRVTVGKKIQGQQELTAAAATAFLVSVILAYNVEIAQELWFKLVPQHPVVSSLITSNSCCSYYHNVYGGRLNREQTQGRNNKRKQINRRDNFITIGTS